MIPNDNTAMQPVAKATSPSGSAAASQSQVRAQRSRIAAALRSAIEFAIYEKARPDKAASALAAVLLTLAHGPSRPAI